MSIFCSSPAKAETFNRVDKDGTERTKMKSGGKAFFVSQKRQPPTRRTAWLRIRKYGGLTGLELPTHPHACGFSLAHRGAGLRGALEVGNQTKK